MQRVAAVMDEAEADVLEHMAFLREHWSQIASTNPLECMHKEIKRHTDEVGIFPDGASIVQLVGALLAEQTDEWHVTRRYLSLETLARIVGPDRANEPVPGCSCRRRMKGSGETTVVGDFYIT